MENRYFILLFGILGAIFAGLWLYRRLEKPEEKRAQAEIRQKRSAMLEVLFNDKTFEEFKRAMTRVGILSLVYDRDFKDSHYALDLPRAFELFSPSEVGQIVGSLANAKIVHSDWVAREIMDETLGLSPQDLEAFLKGSGRRHPEVEKQLRSHLALLKEKQQEAMKNNVINEGLATIPR